MTGRDSTQVVKIDNQAPYNVALSGLPQHNEIGFGVYKLRISATDGAGATPSAGVAQLTMAIDGSEVGAPRGTCSPGPCTASGEWTVYGAEYAAGKHVVEMTATDAAGNSAKAQSTLIIHSAESQPLGPGAVNLASGALTLQATDVSIGSPGSGLSVARSYSSRQVSAGEVQGPFGPQWQGLSFAGQQSLTKLPTGSMLLTSASGQQAIFAKEGSAYLAPVGDANLTLKEEPANTFALSDQHHNVTTFAVPEGGSGTLYTPRTREEPGHAGVAKYSYRTVAGVTEPTQELAPVPTGVSCTTLVKGCRALSFSYASSTSAVGEAPSEWGDYSGRLKSVSFTAYDPGKKAMRTTVVAEYRYDKQGRLRSAWDPRISPALKSTYGYDGEGHLTAITPAGQQPWLLRYGTIEGDPTGGRLVSATRPPASTAFGNYLQPTNTQAPALSDSTPVANEELKVTTGAWSNAPLAYTYQWERCSSEVSECAPILGATNPNYEVTAADAGHRLRARVAATSAAGSAAAVSSETSAVPSALPTYAGQIGTWGFAKPAAVAADKNGNVWVADTNHNQVREFTEAGENVRKIVSAREASDKLAKPQGIAVDAKGNVWVSDSGNDRVVEYNERGEFVQKFGSYGAGGDGYFNEPSGLAFDQRGRVWVTDTHNSRIEAFTIARTFFCDEYECADKSKYVTQFGSKGSAAGLLNFPTGLAVAKNGNLLVADTRNSRLEEFTEEGEYVRKMGAKGAGNGQFNWPAGIATDGAGNIWVADTNNDRIQELSEAGEYVGQAGTTGQGDGQFDSPEGIVALPGGGVWVADANNDRLQKFSSSRTYLAQYGSVHTPGRVAIDDQGHVWATDGSKITEFSAAGAVLAQFGSAGSGNGQFRGPSGVAVDASGNVWVSDRENHRVQEFNSGGEYVRQLGGKGSGDGELSYPQAIALDSKGDLWVADAGNDRVQEFSPSGQFIRQFGGEGAWRLANPEGLAVDPGGHVWVADTNNHRVEEFTEAGGFMQSFGSYGTGNGQFAWPHDVALDAQGNAWVTDDTTRVQAFGPAGEYVGQFGSTGVGPGQFEGTGGGQLGATGGLAFAPDGAVWVVDAGNARIERWAAGQSAGKTGTVKAQSSGPGWTVEYQVPVAGTAAPYALGAQEAGAWAQHDLAVDATAIFPPDEQVGWPASDYRRAGVYYRDSRDRTVNVAAPGGAISTSEYNQNNDVVRTLSADNRAAALKEGANSAQAASLLDTQSTYSADGTQLLETLGPQHEVKLADGISEANEETLARQRNKYFYNEGAPSEGGPYNQLTKRTEGAVLASGQERDQRTYLTSYSGQSNLGWKLRKPTSQSTDPSGLNLAKKTTFDEGTGNATESTTPAGVAANPVPSFSFSFGKAGSGEGQFEAPWGVAVNQKTGNVYVTAYANSRVEVFSPSGQFLANVGAPGALPGQMTHPEAIAIDAKGNIFVGDAGNGRIDEFNEKGEFVRLFGTKGTAVGQFGGSIDGIAVNATHVWVSDTANNRVQQFSAEGIYQSSFGAEGSGNGQFHAPTGIALGGNKLYVADYANHRIQQFTTSRKYVAQFGGAGKGNGQIESPTGIAADPKSGDLYVSDFASGRVERFTSSGAFVAFLGSQGAGNGQLNKPEGVATGAGGELYVVDSGNTRVDVWAPASSAPHTTQTIYYTTASNSKYSTCGKHAEWANLPCRTKPLAQPGTPGLPSLPETSVKYNALDEPETITETFGASTRTKTLTYDEAGRLIASEVTASSGTAVPKSTIEYNQATGAPEKQSATSEGTTRTITGKLNSLGQLIVYTDADGNEATYIYDVDGRPEIASDGRGTQTYGYDTTTGLPVQLVDSAAGTFTAAYDPEGKLLSEAYPNAMTASYTYDSTGLSVGLEYVKTTNCNCTWFADSVSPSIHGQWLSQTSTLSSQVYSYDGAGRLTRAQNTPAGKGCTTRIYSYDEDTNRLSLTTQGPGGNGECSSQPSSAELHVYDPADRLNDAGVAYDAFGNTTKLPPADAGGSELASSYYADNQLAGQTQQGQTIGYRLDPAGRTRETVMTGTKTSDVVSHYAGAANTPVWTSNSSGEWTRNIFDIAGNLAAIQNNGEAPTLQLSNLHGDIIATAVISKTAKKLSTTADTSEFGVPAVSAPPKYSWLGAIELPTELPSGVVAMGARSYVPQIGRFLQPDPVSGGSANAYAYTFGDPVNSSDPSGAYTIGGPSQAAIEATGLVAEEGVADQAAKNAAARREAECRARGYSSCQEEEGLEAYEAEYAAWLAANGAGEEWEEWEEWEEEEWGWEYVTNSGAGNSTQQESHLEGAVLYQPPPTIQLHSGDVEGDGVESSTPHANLACWPLCGIKRKKSLHVVRKAANWMSRTTDRFIAGLPKCYPNQVDLGGRCVGSGPMPARPPPAYP